MSGREPMGELHAGSRLSLAVLVDLAERTTGSSVIAIDLPMRSDENEVYRILLANDRVVYLRIRRPGYSGFYGEAWAMEQARAADVPVPDVLAVEDVRADGETRQAMVLAEAPGRNLADVLRSLSAADRHAVMVSLGRVLAVLHSVSTPGPGGPHRELLKTAGRFEDPEAWPDPEQWRTQFVAARTAEAKTLDRAGLTANEIDHLIALLGTSPDTPVRTSPVLCHGDIRPEHVFIGSRLQVSGLIDWGLWHGGSAIGDLAYIATDRPSNDFSSIVDGHGIWSADSPAFRRAIAMSIAAQAITRLAWNLSIGAADRVEHGVATLRKALADSARD